VTLDFDLLNLKALDMKFCEWEIFCQLTIIVSIYCISRESQTTWNVLWSRASVCVSVRGRMPTLLHGPGCNLGEWYRGCLPSCALLGGFAISARVALLWQHNANTKC